MSDGSCSRVETFLLRHLDECTEYFDNGRASLFDQRLEELSDFSSDERLVLATRLFAVLGDMVEQFQSPGALSENWQALFHRSAKCRGSIFLADRLVSEQAVVTREAMSIMLQNAVRVPLVYDVPHLHSLLKHIDRHWSLYQDDASIRGSLEKVANIARSSIHKHNHELAYKLESLANPGVAVSLCPGEAWTDSAIAFIRALDREKSSTWSDLIYCCLNVPSSKPSNKWLKNAVALRDSLGPAEVEAALLQWFPLVDKPRTRPAPSGNWRSEPVADQIILDHHMDVLKGLCWIAATIPSTELTRALGALALSAYRKVPGIGPRAVKVGNAAVYALGEMPGQIALGQLAVLRIKVKFGTAQKVIEKALDAAAEREALPRDEIDEMAVPSYGLTGVGAADEQLGEFTAQLRVTGTAGASSTALTWLNAKGKQSKAVPAAIKRDFADDLKELKAAAKDIQTMLPAQRDRIDALFLERKTWALSTWRERYLDHPLVGTLARRLIWVFDDGKTQTAAAWLATDAAPHSGGSLVRVDGSRFEPDEDATTVSLWHPISQDAPPGSTQTRDDILAWRAFFEERQIRQPFKQAHREIYLLTDAERTTNTYSNRFAAHIVRQHQFNALAIQRSWKAVTRLMVDAFYPPVHRVLQQWSLRAEFWVEPVGDDYIPEYVLDSGAYRYLSTDQVRFYHPSAAQNQIHAGGGRYETQGIDEPENHPVPLDQIPPIVLSEVLRDVDLFVAVASVGNNPEWQDGGPEGVFRDYWHQYAFGELSGTAQTRRDFLTRLIPRLAIADACTVTDRFLVVLGRKRTYKIHLGSGNIQMEPNNQYLCIVPSSAMEAGPDSGRLFLPFEGDRTLAIILSKAFMLAEDDKITDPTILRQIAR